jgi:hypothetical protein
VHVGGVAHLAEIIVFADRAPVTFPLGTPVASNVIVPNIVEACFFIFALHRVALCHKILRKGSSDEVLLTCVNHRVLSDYTELGRIGCHHFEFDGSHAVADKESIASTNGSVRSSR